MKYEVALKMHVDYKPEATGGLDDREGELEAEIENFGITDANLAPLKAALLARGVDVDFVEINYVEELE